MNKELERLKVISGIEEITINESVDNVNEVAPTDEEDFVNKSKDDFKKRYGKRWKEVLYATAWKKHNKKVKENIEETADSIFLALESKAMLEKLAGIESVNEEKEFNIEKVQFANEPNNKYNLKAVDVNDDYMEVTKEYTGATEAEHEKVKVPKSVKKAVDVRIKELKDSIEKFGGGGPQETALDKMEDFKKLLSSGNLEDYKAAQILYGTLWTEISELLPTAMVSFLHTGKELETAKIQ